MSDNFLMFSEFLPIETHAEKEWLEEYLKNPHDIKNCPVEEEDAEYDKRIMKWAKAHGVDCDDAEHYPDFEYKFENENGKSGLWVHSDESGNTEQVANMVFAFFKHFKKKNERFMLTWAATCSKMRVSEFSGGGFLVTYRKVYWSLPEQELDRIASRLKKGKKK